MKNKPKPNVAPVPANLLKKKNIYLGTTTSVTVSGHIDNNSQLMSERWGYFCGSQQELESPPIKISEVGCKNGIGSCQKNQRCTFGRFRGAATFVRKKFVRTKVI